MLSTRIARQDRARAILRAHRGGGSVMAKEKADSDKGSWFARWRERRTRNKLRASEMSPTDELVAVEVAGSQPEAEMICSLLRSAGFACMPRLTSRGAGAGDGLGTGGQH